MSADTKLKDKTVLLVDDDYDYLLQKKMELEDLGFKIVTACGRVAAEELLKTVRPDMAVIDLMMEEMDSGFVLAYRMKQMNPNLPIIMVTGVTGQTGLEFDSITNGEQQWIKATKIFTKPIRTDQLAGEIKRLLNV